MHDIQVYREKRNLGWPEAAKLVRRAAKTALKAQRISEDCSINVMLTDDAGIRQVNAEKGIQDLTFDLRAYSLAGVRGIRIRYSGVAFNPFYFSSETKDGEDDVFMGVRMIKKMVEMVNYRSAVGVNALQILLKEAQG